MPHAICCCTIFTIALVLGPLGSAWASDSGAPAVPLAQLTEKLEQSTGARLDIELKTGKSYLRCKLVKVTPGDKGSPPKMIKFQEQESDKPVTIGFTAIRSISLDREEIYQAPSTGKKSGKEALVQRDSKAAAAEREKWMASAKAHNMKIWPELSADEHKAEEKKTRERVEKILAMFKGTALYETSEFLFVSDMPREQVVPYASSLDRMYDEMCEMYRIKKGSSVWKGKCLIAAFLNKADFQRFESEFYQHTPPDFAQGLCNCSSDGDVAMCGYRGESPEYFAELLVHETSHGFIHRYRTMQRLPSWVNEGMADWLAQRVGYEGGAKAKRVQAVQAMQQSHSLQGMFQEDRINPIQYGMATHLTDFLIQRDNRKYATWINGMKEGKTWEESLKDAYGLTPEQLLSEFGQAIGVPDLRP